MLLDPIMTASGVKTKLDIAIDRLKAFEPPEGYYVSFSGGKDSQCVYHLCEMAGVKFDAHYTVTGIDPPELVRFIKQNYPDVELVCPKDKNGKRITMWNLIVKYRMPPTRVARYCCAELKETQGKERVTVTGVRWAESARRKESHGAVTIQGKPKTTQKMASDMNTDYAVTRQGGLILNDDNDESRRLVEQCYRTRTTLVNPIIDWTDEEVWEFLNDIVKVPHCCLYDQGYKRLGCIGCPMNTKVVEELNQYPAFKKLYMRAFERMIKRREEVGLANENWETPEKVMRWWLKGKDHNNEADEVTQESEI